MTHAPRILVTGATGAQGGSVARHLLASGRWTVRALTRRPDGAAARALAAAGAEVVPGDLRDRASLRAALRGCYGAFGVTGSWEHFGGELEHGLDLVHTVAGAEIEHLVLSTLPSARKLSGATVAATARCEQEVRRLELPATCVHVAFYYENFRAACAPRRAGDGVLEIALPLGEAPLAAVSVADLGGVVLGVLERPADTLGATLPVAGDELPGAGYAAALGAAAGEPVRYRALPGDVFAALPVPGAAELAALVALYHLHAPSRRQDIEACRRLHPGLRDFASWSRH
ncbi:MAG TPA: NmrA/HSCARG family protein [Thermoanaerobaculia bacterium]|nr:NmrA/HSCARG family protein [Thermoanaerobaculia bacterium]